MLLSIKDLIIIITWQIAAFTEYISTFPLFRSQDEKSEDAMEETSYSLIN